MRTRLALLAALALGALPARAEGPLRKAYLLILASPRTPDEAGAAAAKVTLPGFLRLADGYPRVLESATVPGLKPGFHVVVGGACEARKPLELARQALNVAGGRDTYIREVEVPAGMLGCPVLVVDVPSPRWPAVDRAALDARHPEVRWVVRKKAIGPGLLGYQLALEVAGAEVFIEEYRDEGSAEGDGMTTRFDVSLARVGGAAYARVSRRQDWHDNGSRGEQLLDLACKGVGPVLDLGDQYDFVEAISPVEGASPRARLRLRWRRGGCIGCKPSGEAEYLRAPDGCSFRAADENG